MAYDEDLADRVREQLPGLTESRMFGGLGFSVHGHLAVVVSGQGGLMVRVGRERDEELLAGDGVEPVEMRGSTMRGWVRVSPDVLADPEQLRRWVGTGVAVASALPPKG